MQAVLERLVSQISSEVSRLDAPAAQEHPGGLAHEWTPQQVIEHLVLGYRLTTRALEVRLNKGRLSRNQSRTWLQWLLQCMILSFGYLPRGVPSLEETTPGPDDFPPMDGQQLGELLHRELAAMDAQLDRCKRRFGMERVAVHAWLGPLRVDQWRRFHAVHGVHHVAQLRETIARVAPEPMQLRVPKLAKEMQVPFQRPLA